jgi:4-hydroxybenzoate polyprenyltransferase
MKIEEDWVESLALLFVVIGFFISVVLRSSFLSYASVLLAGFVAGRIYYIKKKTEPIFPFILIILGFLLGYLMGGFWVNHFLLIISFALGFGISYYLHIKNILVTFKSEHFFK